MAKLDTCTVCGAAGPQEEALRKAGDGRSGGAIALKRCQLCGTVYLGDHDEFYPDELYCYYQRYAEKPKHEIYDAQTRHSYARVLGRLARYSTFESILDVGCGKGDFIDYAMNCGYEVMGIDLAKPAVKIAQRFGLPVVEQDFFSKEIRSSSKDLITMFELIEHVSRPADFLSRAEEVLRPGGLLYITTPNFDSLDRRILGSRWDAIHREHLTYFTITTLLSAVEQNTDFLPLHIETRNLSNQLLTHLWRRVVGDKRRASRDCASDRKEAIQQRDFRDMAYRSRALGLCKGAANGVLGLIGAGATIVAILRKPELR